MMEQQNHIQNVKSLITSDLTICFSQLVKYILIETNHCSLEIYKAFCKNLSFSHTN